MGDRGGTGKTRLIELGSADGVAMAAAPVSCGAAFAPTFEEAFEEAAGG